MFFLFLWRFRLGFSVFPSALAAAEGEPLMRSASVPTAIKADATGSSWEHWTGIQNACQHTSPRTNLLRLRKGQLLAAYTARWSDSFIHFTTDRYRAVIHNLIRDQCSSLPAGCREAPLLTVNTISSRRLTCDIPLSTVSGRGHQASTRGKRYGAASADSQLVKWKGQVRVLRPRLHLIRRYSPSPLAI